MTGVRVALRVHACARRDEVALRDGVLVIRVTAPAVDGKANESMRRLIARHLGVPKSTISIVRGHRSRDKVIQIEGIDKATLDAALTS